MLLEAQNKVLDWSWRLKNEVLSGLGRSKMRSWTDLDVLGAVLARFLSSGTPFWEHLGASKEAENEQNSALDGITNEKHENVDF